MALISIKPKFIYIHPFKCAGNSVRKALMSQSGSNYELHGVHCEALDVKTHFYALGNKEFYEDSFKFSFVRNPFDWMVSTYFYIKKAKNHNWHNVTMGMEFPKWLDWYFENHFHTERPYGSNKFITLKEFFTDKEGKIIVDFIGKTENLQNDYEFVCQVLGIKKERVQNINVTIGQLRDSDYQKYYDENSKKLVEKYLGEDLEHFKYRF